MARVKGAKNKPKSTAELEKELRERLATEGKSLDIVIGPGGKPKTDPKPKTPTPAKKTEPVEKTEPVTKSGKTLDLAPVAGAAKEDIETYTCGNCRGKLDGEVQICPHCGVGLSW